MGIFLLPAGLLYVIWAARAALNRPLLIWLALVSTLIIAVFLGAFGLSKAVSSFGAGDPNGRPTPLVAIDPTGTVVELPTEALPRLQRIQSQIDKRDRIHATILVLIGTGAWVVVGLYALEWRWAFSRKSH
jgi:hypothetical protein